MTGRKAADIAAVATGGRTVSLIGTTTGTGPAPLRTQLLVFAGGRR